MSDSPLVVEEIWVNVTEAAHITGYNRQYVLRLANKTWQMPPENRPIKMLKRSSGYDLWLPDLIAYIRDIGHGPHHKAGEKEVID